MKYKFMKFLVVLLVALAGVPAFGNVIGGGQKFDDDFLLRVGQGMAPGWSFVEKFGENPSITTSTDPEDIWSQGGVYTYSTTADIDTISSSHAGDTIAIVLMGLDANWDVVTQTAVLNGQNKVVLTTPIIRFTRAWNGNGTALQGDVYIYVDGAITAGVPNVATTIRGKITIGSEQTEMAIYTVPAGYTGFFLGGYVSVSRATSVGLADFTSRLRTFGGVFRVLSRIACTSSGNSSWQYRYPIPLMVPAKSDIVLRTDEVSATLGTAGGFTMLLRDDSVVMASNPIPYSCLAEKWTKVATNVSRGSIKVRDNDDISWNQQPRLLYYTVKTGDPAPIDGDTTLGVELQYPGQSLFTDYPIDLYIYSEMYDGKVIFYP